MHTDPSDARLSYLVKRLIFAINAARDRREHDEEQRTVNAPQHPGG